MAPSNSRPGSRRCTKRPGNSQARGRDLRNETLVWCLQGTQQRVLADLGKIWEVYLSHGLVFGFSTAEHLEFGNACHAIVPRA